MVDEAVDGYSIGDPVVTPLDAVFVGRRGLGTLRGRVVLLWATDAGEPPEAFAERRRRELEVTGEDARTIAVRFGRDGRRHRDFSEAAELMEAVEFPDFPLTGPRSAAWLLGQMGSTSLGPVARHHRWVRDSGMPLTDRCIHEHEVLSRFFELAAVYDGLCIPNLASVELLARRMQLIEHSHVEDPTNPCWDGARHFMGVGERRGGALVSPALEAFVAEHMRGEAAIAKERRKVRENRTLGTGNKERHRGGGKQEKGAGRGQADASRGSNE